MDLEGRIVGLDVGDVRIGVSVSDPMGIIASPHSVIETRSPAEDAGAICTIVREQEAVRIVAGIPLDREGNIGPQAEKVMAFLDTLRGVTDVEIVTQDERYSTAAAERMLIGAGTRRKKRKQVIDKIAASHILQAYLDREAHRKKRDP